MRYEIDHKETAMVHADADEGCGRDWDTEQGCGCVSCKKMRQEGWTVEMFKEAEQKRGHSQ